MTNVGAHGVAAGNALVLGPDGALYAAGASTSNLCSLKTSTSVDTNLGNMGFAPAGDLAFDGGASASRRRPITGSASDPGR